MFDLKIIFLLGLLGVGLPEEPPKEYLVKEKVDLSVGLYFREYAVLSESVNYITARQIVAIGRTDYGHSVVETIKYPLFYWFDWNQDGTFGDGEQFVDREVLGQSDDIVPYNFVMDEQ